MLTFRAKKRELTYGQHSNILRSLKGCKINHFGSVLAYIFDILVKVLQVKASGGIVSEIKGLPRMADFATQKTPLSTRITEISSCKLRTSCNDRSSKGSFNMLVLMYFHG